MNSVWSRRRFLTAATGALAARGAASPRKNVVFMVADDLNNSLGCNGDPIVRTPHLDAFARRGVLFDQAYCQFPLCSPSRASFLSGLRPDKTGVWTNHTPTRAHMHDVVMLPQLFRQNGWFTADVGKIFHNGAEFEDPPSWDLMETSKEPAVDPATVIEKHQMPKPRNHSMEWEKLRLPDDQTADGRTARRAGELIRQFAQQGKPFFLGVGFHAPHCPYAAPAKYFDLYDPAKIPVPTVPDGYAKTIPEAAWYELAAQVAPNERQTREYRAAYYACISFMDAQAGIVFDALNETRLWDNTVVVFLSDNGYQTGEHGMWHKMTLFDDGTRLPLIIHAPGANGAGRTCHGLVEFVDVYPTLAELCGVKAPPDLDGRSLASALDNPAGGGKQAVYSSVGRNPDRARMISAITYLGQSVRTERWRYTEWDEGRKGVELYDERADRRELHNLAGESGYDAVQKELHNLLHVHSFTVNSR